MDVIYALQRMASPALDRAMLGITHLGSEFAYIVLLVITFTSFDARRGRLIAIYFLAGVYLNQLLKGFWATERPFTIDPSVLRSPTALATAPGAGLPSGHAQASATFWGLAALYGKRRWLTGLAVVIVGAVSLSRLYLGVHLPIDVIVGIALGLTIVGLSTIWERRPFTLPRSAVIVLGLVVPPALHLLITQPDSALPLGALSAVLVGPELIPHETSGPLGRRLLLGLLSVCLVGLTLVGSSALLPPELTSHRAVSYLRAFCAVSVATLLVPFLGRAIRNAPSLSRARVTHK